ncbi:MAG TPA: amidohydrolase family protein, partial [Pseudomonadales bacterium]
ADVSVHHLLLDESAIAGFNSHCHIQPPLRSSADREALLAGVVDGTIDAVCSQHTPVGSSGKQVPFPASKPGIAGVETLLPLLLHLVEENRLTLTRAIDVLTRGAANCLHQTIGHLETGRSASLCVIDTRARRRPSEDWISSTRNSPWLDAVLPGVVRLTVCEGKVSWLSD